MNFFLDNMMSPALARMMQAFVGEQHTIVHIRNDNRFSQDTQDLVWITSLANDDRLWSVISGDITLFQNPTIIAELQKSRLVYFCMDENWCSGNADHSQAWKFLRIWPDIVARARGERPAFYEVQTMRDRPTITELKTSRRARRRRLSL